MGRPPDAKSVSTPTGAAALLACLFLVAALPLIFLGRETRASMDQNQFHLPTIRQFSRELPQPDFHDYRSATTPGYHLLLACAARASGEDSERFLRLCGMSFTAALLIAAAFAVFAAGSHLDRWAVFILCLPLVASPYVMASGAWLLPDNLGWLLVTAALTLALRPRVDLMFYLGSAVTLFALAWVRQTHLWALAPLAMRAWVGADADAHRPAAMGPRVARTSGLLIAALPALLSLAWFFRLWHGLVPPNQRTLVTGGNPAIPAAVLASVGLLGVFYAGFMSRRCFTLSGLAIAGAGATVAAILAVIPRTTYDVDAGRFSGIWNLARHFPIVAGHSSSFIVALAALGGAVMALWLWTTPWPRRWIWASVVLGFVLAQSANHNAYFRYYEPMILLTAALACASPAGRGHRWALAGPLTLALLLSLATYQTVK